MSVTIYSKPDCPQCDLTKRDMDILGIEYKTVDISQQPDELERLMGMGFRSAPVVETKSDIWSGYNQSKIKGLVSYA